jgi:hypothetical protein
VLATNIITELMALLPRTDGIQGASRVPPHPEPATTGGSLADPSGPPQGWVARTTRPAGPTHDPGA